MILFILWVDFFLAIFIITCPLNQHPGCHLFALRFHLADLPPECPQAVVRADLLVFGQDFSRFLKLQRLLCIVGTVGRNSWY